MDRPFLEYQDDHGTSTRYELDRRETLIGRSTSANLVIQAPEVSRNHARITRVGDGFVILDLGSKWGTRLNDELTTHARLSSGDRIALGNFELTFWEPRAAAAAASLPSIDDVLDLTTIVPAAGNARSELEKISLLLELQCRGEQLSSEMVLREIVGHALEISGAERGCLLLSSDGGFEYAIGLDANRKVLPTESFRTSRTLVQKVSHERKPVFMSQKLTKELALERSIQAMDLWAAACLPLTRRTAEESFPEIIGILYLDSTKPMHALSGLDEKILTTLAVEAAHVLEKIEFRRQLEEKNTLEEELAVARLTQKALLPPRIPDAPGYLLRAHCRPTRYVGGDFYDFLELEEDRLVGVVADVSGKGIAASLVSSSLIGSIQMLLRQGLGIDETLASINRYLCERTEPGRFVTLFLFSVRRDGQGAFVSAGHNPAFLFRSSTSDVELLTSGNMMLGEFESAEYREVPMRLDPGDLLLVYSDGITEATNRAGEMFGEDRLFGLFRREGPAGIEAVERTLLEELDHFTKHVEAADDTTFVLLQRAD